MGHVIGIDLGTTNTAVSVVVDGRPKMLEDSHGYKVVPSVVWVGDDGTVKVGQQCKTHLVTDPGRTAFAVKRLIGRHFGSPEVVDADPRVGYDITEADDGTCLVKLESVTLTPVEVSAHILRTAKEMAESALGGVVDEAVITVPAYFNHAQRAATLEAAQGAGLTCERLLNEPTAAALAYGFRKEIDRTILVFDLGGGTFDVSVLRLASGVYEILSTLGDSYLGGEDFDNRIVDWLADRFLQANGVDLREDRMTLHRLKEAAERAKCELSFTDKVEITIPHIADGQSIGETLDRTTLISLVSDYIERSLDVSLNAVQDAGLKVADIDEVILVGGQTRMPAIRSAIADAFGREPSRSVHPEEVVAMGAAVHAASLGGDSDIPPTVLIDVTPFDLGIDVAGNMFQPIISRNSSIPTSASRVFATARANQSSVQVTVRQGASRVATENEFLGEFVMSGLTPAPRMETKVEVTFQIDTNGMLRVSAMEPATGKQTEITVRNYSEVAQSKGAVKAAINRGDGAHAPDEVPTAADVSPKADTDEIKPTSLNKTSRKSEKKKKAKSDGGGLLGALFGRKRKTVKRPEAASDNEAPVSDSIIDQVVAERAAAKEASENEESVPQQIQMPEVDPASLDELQTEMEPAPIAMPSLGAEDLAPLSSDDLAPLDHDDLAPLPDADLTPLPDGDLQDLGAEALSSLEPMDEGGQDAHDEDIIAMSAAGPAVVDLSSEGLTDSPSGPDGNADGIPDASSDETDDDRMERQRQELMERLAHPLDASEAIPDPQPDAAPILPTEVGATESKLDERIPASPPEPTPSAPPAKKPARLKLSYKNPSSVAREYMENLSKGGSFVKTSKPLAVGRQVTIEVRVPSIADDPIVIPGVVTWSSRDLDALGPDEVPGMGIEYSLDDITRAALEARLGDL
jgi:molecular chaperone DnaK